MAAFEELSFHAGEREMHELLHVDSRENPTSSCLTPYAAHLLSASPLFAVGALDENGFPWVSIWGGEAGFSGAITQSVIGVRAMVDRANDPVVKILAGKDKGEDPIQHGGAGVPMAALAIDLNSRNRVKLMGSVLVTAPSAEDQTSGFTDTQLAIRIDSSLGNCPKYLNKKTISKLTSNPSLATAVLPLNNLAVKLIESSDLFFVCSAFEQSLDVNHRGGSRGFCRVLQNDIDRTTLIWPEYSGNRLYQTLGNLKLNPNAGLVFPDFESGDVLYLTGKTDILIGKAASEIMTGTKLAVKITVTHSRFVRTGLAFRGIPGEPSPYNPLVRQAANSDPAATHEDVAETFVQLVSKQSLTPSISRFAFKLDQSQSRLAWNPGQHVALGFEKELDFGYSHMRDDDPQSLNDDFTRTFTVSSSPDDSNDTRKHDFEITIRNVGKATNFLFKLSPSQHSQIVLRGFGGDFHITQNEGDKIAFIAGGIGITPLLTQARHLDLGRFTLYWSIDSKDLGLVRDTFSKIPGLAEAATIFITGSRTSIDESLMAEINNTKTSMRTRRMTAEDLEKERIGSDKVQRWYLCAGTKLRKTVLDWLQGENVEYENFDY